MKKSEVKLGAILAKGQWFVACFVTSVLFSSYVRDQAIDAFFNRAHFATALMLCEHLENATSDGMRVELLL